MNPFDSATLVIDGISVTLPNLKIGKEKNSITFEEPVWVPDDKVKKCLNCSSNFNLVSRKHHCRNCGKIFCSKCCFDKVCLPHLGFKDQVRVCSNCKLVAELMSKAKSDDMTSQAEAIGGLSNLAKTTAGLCKVVESGGIHMIMYLSSRGNLTVKAAVASALFDVTQSMIVNNLLIQVGCLEVIKNLLDSASYDHCELLSNTLSALHLLCIDDNVKVEVLKEGMMDSLLKVIRYTGIVAALAARVLHTLLCKFDYHDYIMQRHPNMISHLFAALRNEDYQIQAYTAKILMYLSAGTETSRHLILQEDMIQGYPLLYLLKGCSSSTLLSAVCIIANLSISMGQDYANQYIVGMCELLDVLNEESSEILSNLARGLANFAEQPANAYHLVEHLNSIISMLLKSNLEDLKIHACRIIIALISNDPSNTMGIIAQDGVDHFLTILFSLPGIKDTINSLLLRKVSRLSVCQELA